MKLPILVFDIETIPDLMASQKLYDDIPKGLTDEELAQVLAEKRQADLGHDFPRLPLHEVVCLSGLWVTANSMTLFSLSQESSTEKAILEKFISSIEKYAPVLVSWNGKAFDVPVLAYRAMLHKLTAPRLFDQGVLDHSTKYNNYQNRYHSKHTDLMDVFARFNPKYFQKLDHIAKLFDLPGKQDNTGKNIDGHAVTTLVQSNNWQALTSYCESDVLNTWLIYLRWLLLIGQLNHEQYDYWLNQTKKHLQEISPTQDSFLQNWQNSLS